MLFNKKTTVCPFCYREINLNSVAFQCSGNGKPGRPICQRSADLRRSQEFGDNSPVMPTIVQMSHDTPLLDKFNNPIDVRGREKAQCPRCGGESHVRLCPHCHSRLPSSLDAGSPMFGLVGVRNSGKTVFLSVLHNALVREVSRQFNASIDTPGGATGYTRMLTQFGQSMEAQAQLPAQTAARGQVRTEPAIYDWKYQDRKGHLHSTVFSFYDSAGEDLVSLERVESQQYLKSANGMILLLDPFAFPNNISTAQQRGALPPENTTSPETVMTNLTEVIRTAHNVKNNKKIKVPIAIAVSKIDAFFDDIPTNSPIRRPSPTTNFFDNKDSTDVNEHMIALINKWDGGNLVRKVEQEFETFRFFGVSALGAEPDYSSAKVNARGIMPHRVVDPLLWLMAERGFIASA